MAHDREKSLAQQLDEAQRTARWWNDCCVSWREKWGNEHREKNSLLEELQIMNGRNRALITEFQRLQAENEKLKNCIRDGRINEEEEKQIARVEPIVEVVKTAKTLTIESPPESKISSLSSSDEQSMTFLKNHELCYSMNDSLPKFKEELESLKNLIENIESLSSENDVGEEKSSMFSSLLERVEGYFMECDKFIQETQRY